MMRFKVIFFVCFVLQLASVAWAAVPRTITHQGYLVGNVGMPLNGPIDMAFALYFVETGGTAVWNETQTVQVNNGIYAVALGAVAPLYSAIFDGDLWLGVTIGSDSEMEPRQKLTSVAFALKANEASTVPDGAITDSKILGPISATKISEIQILQADIADLQQEIQKLKTNYRPVAHAGEDIYSSALGPVYLHGDGSHDPDGDQLSYQWELLSRPVSSNSTLFSSTSETSFFVADVDGTYVVQLVVSDGVDESIPDSVIINTGSNYSDAGDGSVLDSSTGLMWEKNGGVVGPDGQSYYINRCVNLTTAGYTDWRLPSRTELKSVYDPTNADGVDPALSVSGSVYRYQYDYSTGIWLNSLNFSSGYESNTSGSNQFVRCVRGGASEQYLDNGDGTVSVPSTGLMWEKSGGVVGPDGQSYYINRCVNLTTAGYTDWRLPSRTELKSVYDPTNADGVDPALSVLGSVYRYQYDYSTGIWLNSLGFSSGYESNTSGSNQFTRCVRGAN